jgi:fructosamine-3-kinase
MFEAEAAGLHDLAEAEAVRVPAPVCTGISNSQAFIVIEHLDISGRGSMSTFGEQLAQLHRHSSEKSGSGQSAKGPFGWHRNNTIGSTPQINDWQDDWATFWSEQRLGYQLELAARRGIGNSAISKGEKLREKLNDFFSSYHPAPSLLHGDLWSGNYGFVASGEAVIFDPATYYGDREADIAMTELFGGFGQDFYAGYNANWKLDEGYPLRKTLYNAYHILNHFNMFGGGYGSQAESMLGRLLAEVS